jgi:colanic acid/amylovoran biosynthesis glycosyltransferase
MRDRGLSIEVASINLPDRRKEDLPPVEAAESEHTYYVKPASIAAVALQVLAIALGNPGATLRGLRAALRLGGFDLKSRAFAFFYLAEALLVGKWMQRHQLRHLHVHFGGPVATVGMLTAQAWQVPWSVTLHGPDEFFDQDAFYLRQKIDSASFIVCISDFCRSQVLRISAGTPDSRLEVVRLGVDCTALQPRPPQNKPAGPVRIVCTGRMVAAKGHRILLEAISGLLEASSGLISGGIDLSLVLIGDGPERKALEAQCDQQGIRSHVQFLGAMAHQATLAEVAQADIFVLASFAEGLPVALMEAMALGVPCVSTTIAAIPELILDGVNGLLVPPANPQLLAIALEKLASAPALRQKLGVAARATAEKHYNLALNLDLLAATWRRRLSRSENTAK